MNDKTKNYIKTVLLIVGLILGYFFFVGFFHAFGMGGFSWVVALLAVVLAFGAIFKKKD